MAGTHSHTYTFSMYSTPTLHELITELTKVQAIMGNTAKVNVRSVDDQRDGYSLHVTVAGPTQ